MTEGDLTLVLQVVIFLMLTWTVVWTERTRRSMRRATGLIQQYRREVDWLTSRLDALEGKTNQSNGLPDNFGKTLSSPKLGRSEKNSKT